MKIRIWYCLYGDTNSTRATSKLSYPCTHVEAGLRSFDREYEEINCILTDHVSDIMFCPTEKALKKS